MFRECTFLVVECENMPCVLQTFTAELKLFNKSWDLVMIVAPGGYV